MTDTPTLTGYPLREAWRLTRPYFGSSDERWRARGLLALIVALSLGQVALSVRFNSWNGDFYNALQDKNLPAFWHQLLIFTVLAFASIAAAVYRQYLNQLLRIDWRRWLTDRLQRAWLANRAYYRLQLQKTAGIENPDQRIADDIDLFVGNTLSLSIDLLSSVVTLVSFTAILWGLSGTLAFSAFGYDIAIPGYMLWAALLYAIAGTIITHKIGRRLAGLDFEQQRREADFRFALVRVRENAEPIAFYRGEAAEAATLRARFARIVANWREIMLKQKQLTWFTVGYAQAAIIFPMLVAAPRYFGGAIQLGGLMQTASAFGQVQDALSWLINVYPSFASWRATVNRLSGFSQALDEHTDQPLQIMQGRDNSLQLTDVTVTKPDGTVMMTNLSQQLQPGARWLITGPSGSGKTTLLRTIAGLWPYAQGRTTLPVGDTLFLPQRAYLPLGTLRGALSYPAAGNSFGDAIIAQALTQAGLERLLPHLDESDDWARRLSPGEQQLLGLARALLLRPALLLLDEATSALDSASEAQVYTSIVAALPNSIVVSVGHRDSLAAWHTQTLQLT